MVPTGHSWNIMELQKDWCVPERLVCSRQTRPERLIDFLEKMGELNSAELFRQSRDGLEGFSPIGAKLRLPKLSTNWEEQTVIVRKRTLCCLTQKHVLILF